MGARDKSFITLNGRFLIQHVISRLRPQAGQLAINANANFDHYAALGLPIVADRIEGQAGPLSGLLAALEWSVSDHVVTAPCDTPFIPLDLAARLEEAAKGREAAVARSANRLHPACGLWQKRLSGRLEAALAGGMRGMEDWIGTVDCAVADWPSTPYDPFFNVNRPEDLAEAEAIASELTA
jgi:molybdopterin-guanine dinucleotide biosynthesis protein A